MTIEEMTLAANLSPDMQIPVSLFRQGMKITLGQLLALREGLTVMRYSSDGATWHADYRPSDVWMQISTDGGGTWGPKVNMREPDAQESPRPGADGKTLYTWMKFSDTATPSGPSDIYDEVRPTTTAIGWAYNKESAEESDDPGEYVWAVFRGADGTVISKVTEFYAVGDSSTAAPSRGWVEVPGNPLPVMSRSFPYLWNKERTYYTNGAVPFRDTAPALKGTLGADGAAVREVEEYYLASSRRSGVTREDTADEKWTSDKEEAAGLFSSLRPYMWNYEVSVYTDGRRVTGAPHMIGMKGDKGDTPAYSDFSERLVSDLAQSAVFTGTVVDSVASRSPLQLTFSPAAVFVAVPSAGGWRREVTVSGCRPGVPQCVAGQVTAVSCSSETVRVSHSGMKVTVEGDADSEGCTVEVTFSDGTFDGTATASFNVGVASRVAYSEIRDGLTTDMARELKGDAQFADMVKGEPGEAAYAVEAYTLTGDKIKNGAGSTQIYARVLQGGRVVEDSATAARRFTYVWTKYDRHGAECPWHGTASPRKEGNPVTATSEDIDVKATFRCVVTLE